MASSHREKEGKYGNMKQPSTSKKKKKQKKTAYPVEKHMSRHRTKIFILVATCMFTGSNNPFVVPQNFELVTFLLLISSWLVFY